VHNHVKGPTDFLASLDLGNGNLEGEYSETVLLWIENRVY
jgi:hypothetical protein